MSLLQELAERYADHPDPFVVTPNGSLRFDDLHEAVVADLSEVRPGDCVALIGDFDAASIATFLNLVDRGAVLVPLTTGTRADHDYFFDAAFVDVVIEDGRVRRRRTVEETHPLIAQLRAERHPGLVLFSSGTTGRPKAILHDFSKFLARYRTPRPALRTLSFLLFDHIGGINTLFHTLFNRGLVAVPTARTPEAVMGDIAAHKVEVLPTTPTFLRMLLLSGVLERGVPPSLKIVTYGTERMDQPTLDRLCRAMPGVDFRQTYGMSELGILRVKSRARDSLWMRVGGEGVETRVVDGVLQIKSENRMLGYLNAPSPFVDGWYDTGDLVEVDGADIKVVGRTKDVINVGGVKILPSEIERVALLHPGVLRAKAVGVANPITGQHVEVTCQPADGFVLERHSLRSHFKNHLQAELCPHLIRIGDVGVNHRFKQQ
jgi:acyl-coenzyme A synthetase/AMP-(fatty) acid ligase